MDVCFFYFIGGTIPEFLLIQRFFQILFLIWPVESMI